ncbi:MAG: hypothetical protein JO258_07890 [Alphaproteobacteria bacterium]|nr:hypothetical protein [Alphaproteobacteria bacterium]
MRRWPMSLVLPAVLAACAGAPPPAALPPQGVRASFPAGGIANLIHIDALDALPLRAAELVAPDGTATAASYLNVEKNPQANTGQASVNDPWRSSMLGANGIAQTPSAPLAPVYRSSQTLLLTASAAEIPVPDPVAYRRDWEQYRVRVTFDGIGAAGRGQTEEIAAPQPPPGPS